MEQIHKEFLNLVLERNPGMTPRNVLRVALKHPGKALKRLIKDPQAIKILFRRIIKKK